MNQSKEDSLWITKNYKGMTFTARAAKFYNDLLLNRIWQKSKKFLGKIRTNFLEIDPQLLIVESSKEYMQQISTQHL